MDEQVSPSWAEYSLWSWIVIEQVYLKPLLFSWSSILENQNLATTESDNMDERTTPEEFALAVETLANTNLLTLSQQDGFEGARRRSIAALRQLNNRLETPLELSRRIAWQEPAHVAAIKIALDLKLFEELEKNRSARAVSVQSLTKSSGAPEELVGRIMRHLGAWGVVREVDCDQYAATVTSLAFLDPKVSSGIDYWIFLSSIAMSHIPKFVREGKYEDLKVPGKGNFELANGTGKPLFAWLGDHPEALTAFTNHLNAFTDGRASWVDTYPAQDRLLPGAESSGPMLVDVGGGIGRDVMHFHRKFPQAPGRLFVQDLPETIVKASPGQGDSAIEMQGHDFFTPQPIKGSRAYLLHYVLHDWPDDACLRILEHLKAAMRKDYSKLLIAEFVVASKGADPFNTALDLTVMSLVGSKERTEQDWRNLVQSAGMKITGIWSLPGNHESVIEVVAE